ncbi:type III-B CRISPR-associated protein Cas10/Cmr2, partial [Acidianus ambivalens]
AGLKVFMSTDDIAYSYYKEVINPQVRDAEDCKKFEEFLNSEETNVYATFGDPTTARRIINKCSLLPDKSLSFLSKEYGVNNVTKNFVNAIKGYRDSYAIIKADADDMTELARAEIKAERYKGIAKEIVNNNTKGSKRKSDKCAKKLVEDSYEFAHKLAEAINNGYILMSPTYRVALSTAMMLTILRDIKTVEVENHGQIIYAGGDDVVALVSVDRLIDTLVGLET